MFSTISKANKYIDITNVIPFQGEYTLLNPSINESIEADDVWHYFREDQEQKDLHNHVFSFKLN